MLTRLVFLTRLYVLESLRRQVHLITLFLGVVLLMLPPYINAFSLGVNAFERVSKDFGLTIINYYAVAMALFMGATAVPNDAERRTLYPLLARPIPRWIYLASKFLGISVLLWAGVFILTGCLGLSIMSLARHFDARLFLPAVCYSVESSVLAAACLFYSTFSSPPLAGVLGAFTYLVGGLSNTFINFFVVEDRGNLALAAFTRGVKIFLPHFELFHIKNAVVHAQELSAAYVPSAAAYGAAWMLLLLILADLVFARKDL